MPDPSFDEISARDAGELLWPFHDMIRARLAGFDPKPELDASFEPEARRAVDALGTPDEPTVWRALSPGAWRFLSDRIGGAICVMAWSSLTPAPPYRIPAGLDDAARRSFLARVALRRSWLPAPADPQSRRASQPVPPGFRGH